jgi:hypothetical protein
MKPSELKKQIEEIIAEILSEGGSIDIVATSSSTEEEEIKKDPNILNKDEVLRALKGKTKGTVRAATK